MKLPEMDSECLIGLLAQGDRDAFAEIWKRYRKRMDELASLYLRHHYVLRDMYETDDVLGDVMVRIIERVARGQLQSIDSKESFWGMFRKVLAQTISELHDTASALKRGGPGKPDRDVDGRSLPGPDIKPSADAIPDDFDLFTAGVAPPDVMAQGMELTERFLDLLKPELRFIQMMRLDDYSEGEIANGMGVSIRTVERKLAKIRKIWKRSGLGK